MFVRVGCFAKPVGANLFQKSLAQLFRVAAPNFLGFLGKVPRPKVLREGGLEGELPKSPSPCIGNNAWLKASFFSRSHPDPSRDPWPLPEEVGRLGRRHEAGCER